MKKQKAGGKDHKTGDTKSFTINIEKSKIKKVKRFTLVEWVVALLIILLVLNIIGRVIGIISDLWFWIIIIVVAYLAYKKVPVWKRR